MKKFGFILLFVFILTSFVGADLPPIEPIYPIVGTINDVVDDNENIFPADGKVVIFYENEDTYDTYNVTAEVSGNNFVLNVFDIWPLLPAVGDTYHLVGLQGDDGFGFDPIAITISGHGYELVTPYGSISLDAFSDFDDAEDIWDTLVEAGIIDENGNVLEDVSAEDLAAALEGLGLTQDEINAILDILENAEGGIEMEEGGGVDLPPGAERPLEPGPEMQVWFGNRLFQPGIYTKDRPFIIPAMPTIKVDISIDAPYTLASNAENYSIVVDPDGPTAKTLTLGAQHMTQKVYAAGAEGTEPQIRSFSLEYGMTEELAEGEHTFVVSAWSSGLVGTASSTTQTATVEVMGGPVRIVGNPLAYPSPFSPSKDRVVTIQYQLSTDANIDLYLMDPTGRRIKKIMCDAGSEGGSAGINKVTWTGRAEQGYIAGNAIYVGTILSRDEGRLLAKVKLAIVD